MESKGIATFTVCIESVKNNTWQGEVSLGDETFYFYSEIQLLKWMCEACPALAPDMFPFSPAKKRESDLFQDH